MSKTPRPLLVFDGDCGFCRRWIARWKVQTGEAVSYVSSQEYLAKNHHTSPDQFVGSVVLFENEKSFRGAQAVFRTLSHGENGLWLWLYNKIPPFKWSSELFYRQVASHRVFFSRLTALLWGPSVEPASHRWTRWVFLRLLALCYLAAFASFWMQARALVGRDGILPFASFLEAVHARFGSRAYTVAPTILWLFPTDSALSAVCGAGTALSSALLFGLAPGPILAALWALYFSIVSIGGAFMSFQWDMLLIETGFLAIFLAPWRLQARASEPEPPRAALWLLRLLLLRLMFESGCVKLLSGDAVWRNLTALYYHYETQPLPTWLGWWAHQLPPFFQRFSAGTMFAIELGAPWLVFFPRRLRMIGGLSIAGLMVLIALTGNYCYFNLLTFALCATLFDDAFWRRVLPKRFIMKEKEPPTAKKRGLWRRSLPWILGSPVLAAGALQVAGMFWGALSVPAPVAMGFELVESLRMVNSYGLFAVMTRPRCEISVEGSDDGHEWREYRFKWKPGDLGRRPGFVEPFQPRLDWQMWFAALGSYEDPSNRWFTNFLVRLLEGKPEVLALLDGNPFPDAPPKYVRAGLYEYRFTSWAERHATGNWWKREYKRPYCPVLGRRT